MNFWLFFTLFNLIQVSRSWDLSILKVSSTYYASSAAVYKNRAFLALPRSSCFNNVSNPTLIEVPWPEDNRYGVFRKKMYPNYKEQLWGVCKDHQDVVSLDIEAKKAKLWVLDKGNKKCSPKIVIYNLYYNTIGQSSRLSDYSGEHLNYLLVDPDSDLFGGRAFIGGLENAILIFSTKTMKVVKAKFVTTPEIFAPVSTEYLTMSMTAPIVYITSRKDFNLYYVELKDLRGCDASVFSTQEIQTPCEAGLTKVGEKLGPSTAMVADPDGHLNYYLSRDYALVQWVEGQPMKAEYHRILKQSFDELPYVSDLFLSQNYAYALVNFAKSEICVNKKNKDVSIYRDLPRLKSRAVKIG